jgi:hypothetical protein
MERHLVCPRFLNFIWVCSVPGSFELMFDSGKIYLPTPGVDDDIRIWFSKKIIFAMKGNDKYCGTYEKGSERERERGRIFKVCKEDKWRLHSWQVSRSRDPPPPPRLGRSVSRPPPNMLTSHFLFLLFIFLFFIHVTFVRDSFNLCSFKYDISLYLQTLFGFYILLSF